MQGEWLRCGMRCVLLAAYLAVVAAAEPRSAEVSSWKSSSAPHRGILLNSASATVRPLIVQVVVLTMTRADSLARLLQSLTSAQYGRARVHLLFSVDALGPSSSAEKLKSQDEVIEVIRSTQWPHGIKSVQQHWNNIGLAASWLEAAVHTKADFVAILEDDMEVSPAWFYFVREAHHANITAAPGFANLCMNPVGEAGSRGNCSEITAFRKMHFACSWGPVWRVDRWFEFVRWARKLNQQKLKPYLPEWVGEYATFNKWLEDGSDVQSAWVKRWLIETQHYTLTYDVRDCVIANQSVGKEGSFYAINHHEPGVHTKQKSGLNNQAVLLADIATFSRTAEALFGLARGPDARGDIRADPVVLRATDRSRKFDWAVFDSKQDNQTSVEERRQAKLYADKLKDDKREKDKSPIDEHKREKENSPIDEHKPEKEKSPIDEHEKHKGKSNLRSEAFAAHALYVAVSIIGAACLIVFKQQWWMKRDGSSGEATSGIAGPFLPS